MPKLLDFSSTYNILVSRIADFKIVFNPMRLSYKKHVVLLNYSIGKMTYYFINCSIGFEFHTILL